MGKEAEPLSPQCSPIFFLSAPPPPPRRRLRPSYSCHPLNNDSSTTTTHLSPRTACQQPTPRRTQIMESSSNSSNNGSSSGMITIHLSLTSSPTTPRIDLAIDSGGSISALELQTKVSEATNIPPSRLRLIYGGRVVIVQAPRPPPPPSERPQNVLVEYGIVAGSVVHVVAGPTERESAVDARTATGNARSMAGLASLGDTTSTTTSSSSSSNNNSSTLPCTFDNNFNTNNNTTSSSSSSSSLTEALITLQTNNNAHVYHTALATSNKIFTNIITHVR